MMCVRCKLEVWKGKTAVLVGSKTYCGTKCAVAAEGKPVIALKNVKYVTNG